jgi:hypothetical protein
MRGLDKGTAKLSCTGECCFDLSLELRAPHARVAALLGPSAACDGDLRLGFADFPPFRRVVLMVYFSGLLERPGLSDTGGILGECECACDSGSGLGGSNAVPDPFPLTIVLSDIGLGGIEGRWGNVGRDNCAYETAGIVPSPIDPLPMFSVALEGFDVSPRSRADEGVGWSCRDTLSASKRSILSLHCNSNSFTASWRAFSVSVWMYCPAPIDVALCSYITCRAFRQCRIASTSSP